jgi:hypothetical protein
MISLFADLRIVAAATSIASMVLEHQKPVWFKISDYMELVIQVGKPKPPTREEFSIMESPADNEVDSLARTALFNRFAEEEQRYRHLKLHFFDALSDAFTINEVSAICPCIIGEIGCVLEEHDVEYVVLRQPSKAECHVISL